MFTFHWSELLVITVGGLILLAGLAFLMLRRRNELLQEFLTPEEPTLGDEFFRVRSPKPEKAPSEEATQAAVAEPAAASGAVQWGAAVEAPAAGEGQNPSVAPDAVREDKPSVA